MKASPTAWDIGERAGKPQLIVCPDPDAPLVAIEVWVRAGSADETRETSGSAHLLEHMIFKGTAQHPPGALDAIIESAGGILSASTERDWTRFSLALLPDRWEPALRMLMVHLLQPALPETALQRERELILQDEYALHRADPIRTARYAFYARAYGEHHPYALPPLGIPDSLARLSREELMAFHARHYRPERMVIVVVGPVEPARVREVLSLPSVEGEGDPSPSAPLPAGEGSPLSPSAPLPAGEGSPRIPLLPVGEGGLGDEGYPRGVVELAQPDLLAMGVVAPPAPNPDAMLSAEVIRLALAEPHLGLLWAQDGQEEGQPAPNQRPPIAFLQSEYLPRPQPGLMLFFFQACADAPSDWQQRVRQRWQTAVRQIVEGRARPQLEQAKQWLIARHRVAMSNPLERARLYALYATLGIPSLPDEYVERVRSLTAEKIESVARAMFAEGQETQGKQISTGETPVPLDGQDAPATLCTGETPVPRDSANGEERTVAPPHPSPTTPPSIFRQVLSSGVRVIALRQPGASQVVIQAVIAFGADAERDLPAGTGELTARMLFTATRNETQASLAYRIARSGGSLQLYWEPIGVRILAVAEPATLENVLSLLREGLTRAEFEPDVLHDALQMAIAERRRMDAVHELPLYDTLFRTLYGTGGLYASAESLKQVRLEHVKAFYQRYYRADRFVFVIAGDMPVERLTELMQRYFGSLNEGAESEARSGARLNSSPMAPRPAVGLVVDAVSCPQNAPTLYIGFGQRVPLRSPEEYAMLLIRQAMLCEGKSCTLFREFRAAQGMGYAFGGTTIIWQGEAVLMGFLQLGASRAPQQEALLKRLQTMLSQPETQADALDRARALVEARWRRDRMDIFERTRRLALAEAGGVGYLAEETLPERLKRVDKASLSLFSEE